LKKVRVVHLSYNNIKLKKFGIDSWLNQIDFFVGILEHMAEKNEVHAFFHPSHHETFIKNNVVYHFTDYTKWQLLFPIGLNSFVRKLHPDVVIVHGLIFPFQVIMLSWQLGASVKIIAQHHAERPQKDFRQYLQRLADRYVEAYLFCSVEMSKEWLTKGLIRNSEKIHEVMEASSRFRPIDRKVALTTTKISDDLAFLWVGRLNAGKNPLLAVNAFIRFRRNKPNAHLYMIYQTEELLQELKSLIEKNGANNYIHLVGKVEHSAIQYWFNSVNFIISTSRYEGSGIAVCEAMACGCVPIVSDIPSFRMMTDNGRAGELSRLTMKRP
jgi:glycosyltransferase involved in cell wall biosynthesis